MSAPRDRAFSNVARIIGGQSGFFAYPTLSPDGHAVADASDKSGSLGIYVNSVAPRGREIAITSDGGRNTQPA